MCLLESRGMQWRAVLFSGGQSSSIAGSVLQWRAVLFSGSLVKSCIFLLMTFMRSCMFCS